MNGDVGKELCGEHCPTSDPPDQEMSNTPKHGSNTDLSVEKMTDAVAPSTEMKDNPQASMTSENKEEPQNGETQKEENKEKISVPLPEERAESEREAGRENNAEGLPTTSTTTQNETRQVSHEPLTREQIKELVSQNVEYFFSRENWSSDPYLLSQMDSDQYVPVYILANCSQFKSITKDHSIIMDVLKDSVFVQLDEENNRVRPNYKRCIVILREIPKTTPVKEIEAMFEGEGCPKSLSCEFVHNDFWYVTFESDSDAQKAYRYLRETVKTFKDKPILARIKTKPMSRIGCLSVLPSYGAKNQPESRENLSNQGPGTNSNSCMPPGGPTGPGMQGVPNPPQPPNAYPPGNPPRMFYPPQNPFPSYNFASSAQITTPTAYFYPNPMVPWAPNFYDINSFIQYNGLSPRATYKPPTNTRFNNNANSSSNNNNVNGNINRRNKSRDNRFEKPDSKHSSSTLNGTTQMRSSQASSRPQSAHSPHPSSQSGPQNTNVHSSNNPAPPSSFPKEETQNNTSSTTTNSAASSSSTCTTTTTTSSSSSSTVVHNSHTFAQNDLCLASQSNLYTSFSPPAGGGVAKGSSVKGEKGENGSNNVSISPTAPPFNSVEASIQNVETPPVTSGTPATTSVASSCASPAPHVPSSLSQSTPAIPSPLTTHVTTSQILQTTLQPQHHHQPQSQCMTASHRNNLNESHPIRETQPQRQMSRGGGRRRVPRRDEEMNGYPGPGGRGPPRSVGIAAASDSHPKNGSSYTETKKPFELQATSFPPLPSADEVAASVPEEKAGETPSQAAWSGETHKFSDVMKGTAKPKQAAVSTNAPEKEASPPETSAAVSTTNTTTVSSSHTTGVGSASSKSLESGTPSISQPGTTSDHPSLSTHTAGSSSKLPSEGPQGGTTVSTSTVNNSSNNSGSTTLAHSIGRQERGGPFREQRPLRDDRRGPGPQGLRREREFVPGIGRANIRKEREAVGFRLSGNKENRPQSGSSRSWREDRADPDGWITKGPKEGRNHRENRYHNQHTFYDNRNGINKSQAMVNGESSSPPSPHRPDVMSKHVETTSLKPAPVVSKGITKPDVKPPKPESVNEKENNLNNNEGEHKTSWAKMALASKDHMERLSAELKEKEEQERLKKIRTAKPPNKLTERVALGREREGKPFRRDNFPPREREAGERGRDFRGSERNPSFGIKPPVKEVVPKSPK